MKQRSNIAGPVAAVFFRSLFLPALCLLAGSANAQNSVPVELIGTFLSGETTGPGVYRLEYEGLKRTFDVRSVRLLAPAYAGSASGWDVLNEVGGRRILLTGEKGLILPLMQGKASSGEYALVGTLYLPEARMALEAVREVGKQTKGRAG